MAGIAVATAAAWCLMSQAWSQESSGRGARDPLPAQVKSGPEGKGLFTGAGVPPGNTPIIRGTRRGGTGGREAPADRHLLNSRFLPGPDAVA